MAISFVQSQANAVPATNSTITTNITSTAGNTLVAVMAANVSAPAWYFSAVKDSANNYWQQVATVATAASTYPSEVVLAVWVAYNAAAVSSVTATLANTAHTTGAALKILEFSGVTNTTPLDVQATTFTNSGTTLTPAASTTNAADAVVAAVAVASANTLTHTADAWTTQAEAAATSGSWPLRLDSAYLVTSTTGAQSTTWTASAACPIAGVIAAFRGGVISQANVNPNWPQLTTRAAFGTQPNASAAYAYTADISQYVLEASIGYGMPYELGTTEAGQCSMKLYNEDGRFDPSNPNSPYSPNVKDYVPFQMQATWNGQTYGVFSGFVERWPNSWDEALTGISQAVGVDAFATLARVQMKSCMQHEVLMDNPWAYWPLNDAGGSQFAANLATGSGQAVTVYPTPPHKAGGGTADFGAATAFAGDMSTGWGQSTTDATNDQGWTLSTGVIPSSTFPALASGVTAELWVNFSLVPAKPNRTNIVTLKSSAASWATHTVLALTISQHGYYGTSGNVWVDTWDTSGNKTSVDIGTHSYSDGLWHHVALTVSASTVTLYIDGVAVYTGTRTISTATIDLVEIGGVQDSWEANGIGIGSYAHVAVYSSVLPLARIQSHWHSGHDGFPEDSGSRINRILTYAGWTGPRALDTGSSILAGCYSIQGQFATDSITDVALWEYGLAFADGNGAFRFKSRKSRFAAQGNAIPITIGATTTASTTSGQVTSQAIAVPSYTESDILVCSVTTQQVTVMPPSGWSLAAQASAGTPSVISVANVTTGASSGYTTSVTANAPTYAAGDMLIAFLGCSPTGTSAPTITPPAGWTQLGSTNTGLHSGTPGEIQQVWYKTAATEPASYTWTFTGTTAIATVQVADVKNVQGIRTSAAATADVAGSIASPALAGVQSNDLVLFAASASPNVPAGGLVLTMPNTSGWTVGASNTSPDGNYPEVGGFSYKIGATDTPSARVSSRSTMCGFAIALIPTSPAAASGVTHSLYYRAASGEPASYTWQFSAPTTVAMEMIDLKGAAGLNVANTAGGSNVTSLTAPSLVGVNSTDMVVISAGSRPDSSGAQTLTLPGGTWTADTVVSASDTTFPAVGGMSTKVNGTDTPAVTTSKASDVVVASAAFIAQYGAPTSLAIFGDGPGEDHYQADIVFDYDPTYQYDDVQITRQGPGGTQGITQFSGDPNGAIAQYFTSTLQQTIGVLSDSQAADRAAFLYNLLSVPQLRVQAITIDPSADPSLWPIALGAQIGGRYTIRRRALGSTNPLISLDVIICEIKHEIKPGSWKTTFATLPASTPTVNTSTGPWILNDATYSVLGTTTIPGW